MIPVHPFQLSTFHDFLMVTFRCSALAPPHSCFSIPWKSRIDPSAGQTQLPILILTFLVELPKNCSPALIKPKFWILFLKTLELVALLLLQTHSAFPKLFSCCFSMGKKKKEDYSGCNFHGNNYHKVLIAQDRLGSMKG